MGGDLFIKILKFVASILITFSAAAIGSIFTIPNIPIWYSSLEKPPLLPPNEIFGPIWSILYLLISISLYLVWTAKSKSKKQAYIWFAIQLTLNALWSIVFFGLHQAWLATVIILVLIFAIIMNILKFKSHSKQAALLLVPYLCWVIFASYLTIGVSILNK